MEELVEPVLDELGFELVQLRMMGSGRTRTLQVMAEPKEEGIAMTVDHCADISRAVSAVLDAADPIEGAYLLEVSSPGVDRPLTKPAHFERFVGFEAKVELAEPSEDGRKRLRGKIKAVGRGGDGGAAVTIEDESGERVVPFADVRKAKLVLSDELLAAGAAIARAQDA